MPSLPNTGYQFEFYYESKVNIIPNTKPISKILPLFLLMFILMTVLLISKELISFQLQREYTTIDQFDQVSTYHTISMFIIDAVSTIIFSATLINTDKLLSIINTKLRLILLIFLLFIISFIPSFFIVYYKTEFKHSNLLGHSDVICTKYFREDDCYPFNMFSISRDIFFPSLYLPTMYWIIFMIFTRSLDIKQTNYNKLSNTNGLEMALIINSDDHNNSRNSSYSYSFHAIAAKYNIYKHIVIVLLFILGYFLSWFGFYISTNTLFTNKEYAKMYLIFLFSSSFCKFIMKRIARYIDYYKILENDNKENTYCFCMEYMMEWMFSSIYWNWIRQYILYDSPAIYKYFVYIIVHFFAEGIESNLKWSEFYYKLSAKIIDKYALLRTLFPDNSDLDEWRKRLSMDMIARFHASILISIIVGLQMIVFGEHNLREYYGDFNYQRCMWYLLISTFIEFIHYGFTIGFVIRFYNLNPLRVFIDYLSAMKKWQRFCFVLLCSFFMIMYH